MQVKIGFLPVGHTHEDIDQLFSCVQLKHTNVYSITGINGYFKCVEQYLASAVFVVRTKASH